MNLFERFAAAWAVLNGDTTLGAKDGKPELTEENVAALEAAATEIEGLREENTTLKDEAATHAQALADAEQKATDAAAKVTAEAAKLDPLKAALAENNVELAEGADVVATAVEKINAWGKAGGSKTAAEVTNADDLGDGGAKKYHASIDDEVAAARAEMGFKNK